jgi:hypothetical protein
MTKNLQPRAAPALTEYQLNQLADRITFGVLLACVAELGPTRRAIAAAFAAVALTDAIETEENADASPHA